jgi:hypothetical protein
MLMIGQLQALRDLILIRWSTKLEESTELEPGLQERGLTYASQLWVVLKLSWHQYRTLLETRRLRNAVWSTCTVALSQQLCGSKELPSNRMGLMLTSHSQCLCLLLE